MLSLRKDEAALRPKVEFVPKTLADLNIEGVSDGVNGTFTNHHHNTIAIVPPNTRHAPSKPPKNNNTNHFNSNTTGSKPYDPFDPWSSPPQGIIFFFLFYLFNFIYLKFY